MHFVIETNTNWDGRWMESSCFAFMSWKLHGVISFVILSSYPFFHIGRKAEPSKYNWGESTRHRQAFLMSLLQKYYLSIGLYVNREEKNPKTSILLVEHNASLSGHVIKTIEWFSFSLTTKCFMRIFIW